MSRRAAGIRARVIAQHLGKAEPRLTRRRRMEAAEAAALADRVARRAQLEADRPPANRREHPHDEDQRNAQIRALDAEIRIIEWGPGDVYERAGVLAPIARAAGIEPPPGSLDPSGDLQGLHQLRRDITALETEIADLRAELAALDVSDSASASSDAPPPA